MIHDAGDAAVLLELEARIDPAVNARAIAIASALAARGITGVRDVVPTFRSVAVHFDPRVTDVDALRAAVSEMAAAPVAATRGALVEVPVAYGGENGPDLAEVAAFANAPEQAVINRHAAPEYRVFMLGFLPGFAYMGSVDETIAAPRRATPRTRIPCGSVGIAGRQTGVYPRQSPGGWQLIGRTALRVFDPNREPAALFAPGDRVRFVPLDGRRATGYGLRASQVATPKLEARIPNPESRQVTVLRPGLFTTIQDSGRWGCQDRGVPVSGAMDAVSCRLANALVGNHRDAAALEATLLGPELRLEQAAAVAVAGADLGVSIDGAALPLNTPRTCAAGSVIRFGERRLGTRAYLAFDGGVDVEPVLGSRSTHVVSGLGGVEGRALIAGDRLPLGVPSGSAFCRTSQRSPHVLSGGGTRLRALRGPQDDQFDERAFELLQRTRFIVSPQSDRMGYRLRIPNPESRIPDRSNGAMISDAAFVGGLQVPPSGEPILLMADRQTTGGYPQMVTVITADLPAAGQLAPGDWVEFALCTRAEAIAALREQDEALRAV